MKRLLNLLSYPRSVLATIWIGLFTIFMSIVVLSVAILFRNKAFTGLWVTYVWARPVLWVMGVTPDVRGLERLPQGSKGYLILFNHTSLADIPMLHGYFPKIVNFGAKAELFKVPVFGAAMKIAGTLKIDRADRKGVMQIYQEAITRVNNGEVFALAPEGTRQMEPVLGRFKKGPFEFAANAQMNLVPVLIAGALEVLPKDSIWFNKGKWRRTIIMEILEPIPTEGLDGSHLDELQNKVRASMESAYNNLNRELGIAKPITV